MEGASLAVTVIWITVTVSYHHKTGALFTGVLKSNWFCIATLFFDFM